MSGDTLADWLAFLGTPDCPCEYQWKGLGVLCGVSFGKGWVRVTDAPGCPHHGIQAGLEALAGRYMAQDAEAFLAGEAEGK